MKAGNKKAVLRKKARSILGRIRDRREKEKRIFQRIKELSRGKNVRNVFTYVSRAGEADTIRIIRYFLRHSKRVFVPRVDPEKKSIRVYRIADLACLKKGAFQIPEPMPGRAFLSTRRSFDLLLVPALAFDRQGTRLGRGGGYFDRFLRSIRGKRVGICFKEQLCGFLPREKHDEAVDLVVSD